MNLQFVSFSSAVGQKSPAFTLTDAHEQLFGREEKERRESKERERREIEERERSEKEAREREERERRVREGRERAQRQRQELQRARPATRKHTKEYGYWVCGHDYYEYGCCAARKETDFGCTYSCCEAKVSAGHAATCHWP